MERRPRRRRQAPEARGGEACRERQPRPADAAPANPLLALWRRPSGLPRSFADSDGDGVGDLPSITARLDHLAGLGVDAVWLTPFYRSRGRLRPRHPHHSDVDPTFGTLADADALIARAHALGLRVIVDWVPNHTWDRLKGAKALFHPAAAR